jgi:K+-sensing histidine kinase KdpD
VVKCFEPNVHLSELKLEIHGPSSGFTYGAPVFELVPFVLIENAVKYAPKRSPITVKISDFDDHIDAHVQSFGPKITKAELSRIFEQGFRAEAARKTGKSGSGVGLFAAWSLVRGSFHGTLTVAQDPVVVNFDGVDVWRTTFSCRVPRAPDSNR